MAAVPPDIKCKVQARKKKRQGEKALPGLSVPGAVCRWLPLAARESGEVGVFNLVQ